MNTTKTTSIILSSILILSIIAFAQGTEIEQTPENLLKDAKELNLENEENREQANQLIKQIIKKTSTKELTFTLTQNAKLDSMTIENNKLKITLNEKTFTIPPTNLDNSIVGFELTENELRYITKNGGKIGLTDPEQTIEKDDDKYILKFNDKTIHYNGKGRISFKPNGEIEFSGEATIYDPATKTSFKLKDTTGKPGYIDFYKEGHIVRRIGNNIIVEKEDSLSLNIKKTNENGMFILSENGITKDSYSDYPPGLDKTNSLLIDSENKNIYIPENENAIGHIIDNQNEYQIFGNPDTPQGGTILDGSLGFGGGKIFGTGGKGGSIKATDSTSTQGGYDTSRGGITGGGGGSKGSINSWLPFILIGAAGLAAILLLKPKKDKSKSYKNQTKESTQTGTYDGSPTSNINDSVTTGREATTTKPTIQSTYNN